MSQHSIEHQAVQLPATLPPMPRFYYFGNRVLRHLLFPLTRVSVQVEGVERVPRTGPLLIVGNHTSLLDPPLVATIIPRDVVFMSKAENFQNPLFGWIARNYGAFPVKRGEADIGAIRQSLRVLKRGGALFIAPEGTRSPDGRLGEPHEGAALIALRAGAPLLPMGISGADRFSSNLRRWQPTPVQVRIGEPFYLDAPRSKADRHTLRAMSEAIMERIAAELPSSRRGRFRELSEKQHLLRPLLSLVSESGRIGPT